MSAGSEPTFIHDILRDRAAATPEGLCWVLGDRDWTWSQAWEGVQRTAGALRTSGISRGDVVAFVDKNHPAATQLALGCGLLGAAVAILNWRLSADELDYALDDSGARMVFVGGEFTSVIARLRSVPGGPEVVVVGGPNDEFDAWVARGARLDAAPAADEDDTCVILYSSGTSGRPKGVRLTHRNYVGYMLRNAAEIPGTPGGMMILASPMFHVGGTSTALVSQAIGLASFFVREVSLDALEAGLDAGATHVFLVPAVVAQLIQAGPERLARFAQLDVFIYGAMPMPKPVLDAAIAAWPTTVFMHCYGMTELAGVATYLHDADHRDTARPERLVSVGRSIPGVEAKVVDVETLDEVRRGAAGELWFRTVQATPGYLHRPDATRELITDDGWIRTGDVGRMDEDGYIFVEDRLKDMVITGGENVYSPEVERVLAQYPGVLEAVIIGVPDDRWGETVKAVVVPLPGAVVDVDALIAHCRSQLAHYKAPTSVDIVAELPRNIAGKILKRTLREPYWAAAGRQV
ncbi:class I adenylate-forming enzyme family protein [Microbacterium gorillae]|uniref:class I adenylate-forming enzyme family protein n=1 Tax=Microbacterium gorillae TaxID=1231063 RepID=UPI00058B2F76|nr:AMP-binding protein [Microbacterium gorillae]